ncbi:MAG TPA: molybdopterin cofactor-binding domain-containing protein [Stellaceae bacterium]|nr:molybdopterin cofactor-binding domain-containing protein [Stellaceae bacterium]
MRQWNSRRDNALGDRNKLTRRVVLEAGLAGSAGLLLSSRLVFAASNAAADATTSPSVAVNAWVRIGADNSVTLIASQSEMGQGISTTLTAALADELGVDWTRVKIEFAPFGEAYRFPGIQMDVHRQQRERLTGQQNFSPLETADVLVRSLGE